MSISKKIASDTRVEVAFNFGDGRLLVKIPIGLVGVDPKLLGNIRSKSPDTDRLLASIKQTGTIFDQILVYAEVNQKTDQVVYLVADGHQRLKTAIEAGHESIFVQVVTRWTTAEEAYREAVSKQYARFEMQDKDLFGIIKENKITNQELVTMTGKSETTILRMRKVSSHQVLIDLIDEQAITTGTAVRLVDKCDKNPTKIAAMIQSIKNKLADAKKESDHYKNKYKIDGKPKKKNLADLATVAYYFKDLKLDEWESAINDVQTNDVELKFDQKNAKSKAEIEVSEAKQIWDEEIAVYFIGGQRHDDMSLSNLRKFRDSLPMIGGKLDAIISRRELAEAKQAKATGRRVPVRLDPSTHRSYIEESLRIISDEDFQRVQLKLASKSKPRGATQARRVVRPFTGLIYCSECNGVFYAQKSTNRHDNAKSKHYYSCSCRARNGAAACSNSEIYREDSLVAEVLETYQGIFADTDSIIAEITSEAQKQIDSNRDDANRMRSELAASTKLTDGLAGLLLDPEMAREAKGVIKRRIAEEGAKQESLQTNLDRLVERANRTSERLIEMVSRVFSEAQETFDAVGSPEKLHAFMEHFVGPSVSHPDGRLLAKPINEDGSGASGAGLNGYIAATGVEPVTLGL